MDKTKVAIICTGGYAKIIFHLWIVENIAFENILSYEGGICVTKDAEYRLVRDIKDCTIQFDKVELIKPITDKDREIEQYIYSRRK